MNYSLKKNKQKLQDFRVFQRECLTFSVKILSEIYEYSGYSCIKHKKNQLDKIKRYNFKNFKQSLLLEIYIKCRK